MIQLSKPSKFLFIGLGLLCLLIFLGSLSLGEQGFQPGTLLSVLTGQTSQQSQHIILNIRLPRLLACVLGGASLAVSGLLLQTLTRNPLADSGILGINTGAGVVVAITIALYSQHYQFLQTLLPFLATLGALATVTLVYLIAKQATIGFNPIRLIIIGVALSTMLSSLMIALVSTLNHYKVTAIVQWLSGRIQGDDWQTLIRLSPLLLLLCFLSYRHSRSLNILALNDYTALALGMNLAKERRFTLIIATNLAALSVVLVGNIAFIGLLAGNFSKQILGNEHKQTIPFAMMLGTIILIIADTISRVFLVGTDIPTGLLVSLIGAPYFLYLLMKQS